LAEKPGDSRLKPVAKRPAQQFRKRVDLTEFGLLTGHSAVLPNVRDCQFSLKIRSKMQDYIFLIERSNKIV